MKRIIGITIAQIGAHLWEHGGWSEMDHQYSDLTIFGKIGVHLFVIGCTIAGVDFQERNS